MENTIITAILVLIQLSCLALMYKAGYEKGKEKIAKKTNTVIQAIRCMNQEQRNTFFEKLFREED